MKETTTRKRPVPSVLIVSEFDICRTGLRAILAADRSVKVAGELAKATTPEMLAACDALHPDLVLLSLTSRDQVSVIRAIKAAHPRTTILTMCEGGAEQLVPAVEAGASGCVGCWASREEVVSAVGRVLAGECILPPELVPEVFHLAARATRGQERPLVSQLTRRQLQVLALIARGKTNREIAAELRVSLSTVKGHVERIIDVLDVSDRTQAAVHAIELGLLDDAAGPVQATS